MTAGGPAPRILRRCDACGEESWRPLGRRVAKVTVNGWLADGRRADLVLRDRRGEVVLAVQLVGGSRLPNRSETAGGAPLLLLDGAAVAADPLRLRPLRERGLRPWRCRCALARALPVDDAFSLRVIGCPINVRPQGPGAPAHASVVQDCARCGFFVGIGYSDPDRRRVSLYCSFGSAAHLRIGPSPAPRRAPAAAPPRAADAL